MIESSEHVDLVRPSRLMAALSRRLVAGGAQAARARPAAAQARRDARATSSARSGSHAPRLHQDRGGAGGVGRGDDRAARARRRFDEDHTQRVASPIDGRAVAILVKAGRQGQGGPAADPAVVAHVGQLQADAQKAMSDLSVSREGGRARAQAAGRGRRLREGGRAGRRATAARRKSDYARTTAQLKSLGVSPTDPAVNVGAARADRGRGRRAQRAGRPGGARRSARRR